MEKVVNGNPPPRSFWSGKRVFVTGHTGFKGSWLVARLVDLGASVHCYSLPPEQNPNAYELLAIGASAAETIGDVCDADRVRGALVRARPQIVFHLAAQALVRRAYREPAATFATNVMGTVSVLEAVRACDDVESVLVVTSDKVYANREARPQCEDDPLGGTDPYSASKGCAEIVASSYRASYFQDGPRLATARAGNVIGGGDWSEDRIVPDIVRAAQRGEAVRLRYPNAVRPWQFVGDAVNGYLAIVEALSNDPAVASSWNLGPLDTTPITVIELVRRFLALYDPNVEIVIEGAGPGEAAFLALDAGRARDRLGWRPRYDPGGAIEATARWYGAWRRGEDLRDLTLEQLRAPARAAVR